MSLFPTALEMRSRALADLRLGLPIIIDMPQPLMVCAAETLTNDRLEGFRELGEVHGVISKWRADTLKINVYDGDLARLKIPNVVDSSWCRAVADPISDLSHPMKGPFKTLRGGSVKGQRLAISLLKAAQMLPMAIIVQTSKNLKNLTKIAYFDDLKPNYYNVVSAALPLEVSESCRLHVFRPNSAGDEHYALEIGTPERSLPVLTRLHSACFTGDILGSLKCDCGPQLESALAQMGKERAGILLYLNQEGRGIGLANKMRAYALQGQGFDTVDANHRLGFEDDERDFQIGAELLKRLGFMSIRLMTNNPNKVARLQGQGVQVTERVPLIVGDTLQNRDYLRTKAEKSGHLL